MAGERDSLPPFDPFSRSLAFWTFSPLFPFSVGLTAAVSPERVSLPPSLPPSLPALSRACMWNVVKKGNDSFSGERGGFRYVLLLIFLGLYGLNP